MAIRLGETMSEVAVLVPFRGDGAHRQQAWNWLAPYWAWRHPTWTLYVGDAPAGPWSKGAAVAAAYAQLDPDRFDVLLVVDADVFCEEWQYAVDAVAGGVGWAIPHKRVHRLDKAGTAAVLAGGGWPPPPWIRGQDGIADVYTGVPGGGAVALSPAMLRRCPPDPRFEGWGQEDMAWAHALDVVAGRPFRGFAPLWHLWHEPQPRMTPGIGSDASYALYQRYRAQSTADGIAAIVDEADGLAGSLPGGR